GGNAAALALFATDSWKGTYALATGSAESQSAAVGGALQMAPANIQNDPLLPRGPRGTPYGSCLTLVRSEEWKGFAKERWEIFCWMSFSAISIDAPTLRHGLPNPITKMATIRRRAPTPMTRRGLRPLPFHSPVR